MKDLPRELDVSITWRGKKFSVRMSSNSTFKELGHEMQKLTKIKGDTMRFIVPPMPNRTSTLLTPFSEEHEGLCLHETSIAEGKPVRMMGVSESEVDEILEGEKLNLRIAGFDEEEKRLRQRNYGRPLSRKLPQGTYIFCDFRTLSLPGIKLNPSAPEALQRMHMLASDPGIVAVMNKHRWRVGIMTEMAPIGYVGVSPKCILGFNKNQGEEISLRLRTDDLKGFRKYESIKKTLLHELAHMVYSEHDANFFALDSQLNKEAASLDWTRSNSHTLSGIRPSDFDEEEFYFGEGSNNISQKLGGNNILTQFVSARDASVASAYRRFSNTPTNSSGLSEIHEDDQIHGRESVSEKLSDRQNKFEPDPDDIHGEKTRESGSFSSEDVKIHRDEEIPAQNLVDEPDPDDLVGKLDEVVDEIIERHENVNPLTGQTIDDQSTAPVDNLGMQIDEPDPDDEELRRIHDPVKGLFGRFQKAIEVLRAEVGPAQASVVLETQFKIISNVIEHPDETKFRRLRKANPVIQRNIANYKASVELLGLIGFYEEVVSEQTYFVLKRNDPGLLWLAKSCIETNITR